MPSERQRIINVDRVRVRLSTAPLIGNSGGDQRHASPRQSFARPTKIKLNISGPRSSTGRGDIRALCYESPTYGSADLRIATDDQELDTHE